MGQGRIPEIHLLKADISAYVRIVLGCALGALIVSLLLAILQVNLFNFFQMPTIRTGLVLFVFFYLNSVLISIGTRHEILLITTIPFLTQFYNIALGWDVAGGADNPVRLLPLLVMITAMAVSLFRRSYRPRKQALAIWALVILVSILGSVMSMDISVTGPTLFLLMGLLVPLFYFFIDCQIFEDEYAVQRLQLAILLGVLMLMVGNLATVTLGMGISVSIGAGSLVGTRNMGDFNNIFTFLILAWPFAFSFIQRQNIFLAMVMIVLLVVVVSLGFSRTALFLSPVILLLSIWILFRQSARRALGTMVVVSALLTGGLSLWSNTQDMLFFWYQRLDFSISGSVTLLNALQSIAPGGDAFSYRSALKQDAVKLFSESPLIGHGWGSFRELSASGFGQAHSLTHDLLVETGIFGAGLFWLMVGVVILNFLHLWRVSETDKLLVALFTALFCLWLLAGHTLGAQLYSASKTGIQVNIINGILFVLFLNRDLLLNLVLPCKRDTP